MHIFLMRHGEAEQVFQSDRDRSLTDHGRQQSTQTGAWLKAYCEGHQLSIDKALVSPYRRAQQTYQALAENASAKENLSCSDIVPSGDPLMAQSYMDFLFRENVEDKVMLLVSHMPFVSYLLDHLCAKSHSMLFATASVAVLDYDLETGKAELIDRHIPD